MAHLSASNAFRSLVQLKMSRKPYIPELWKAPTIVIDENRWDKEKEKRLITHFTNMAWIADRYFFKLHSYVSDNIEILSKKSEALERYSSRLNDILTKQVKVFSWVTYRDTDVESDVEDYCSFSDEVYTFECFSVRKKYYATTKDKRHISKSCVFRIGEYLVNEHMFQLRLYIDPVEKRRGNYDIPIRVVILPPKTPPEYMPSNVEAKKFFSVFDRGKFAHYERFKAVYLALCDGTEFVYQYRRRIAAVVDSFSCANALFRDRVLTRRKAKKGNGKRQKVLSAK